MGSRSKSLVDLNHMQKLRSKPSPGGLQDPLSLPIEEKKIFVDKWPQNNRDFAKILSGSDFARGRGKVVLSRAQKLKNNICSWVLGDWDLV